MGTILIAAAVIRRSLIGLPAAARERDARSRYRTAHGLRPKKTGRAMLAPWAQRPAATRTTERVAPFDQLACEQGEGVGSAAQGGDRGRSLRPAAITSPSTWVL